MKRRLLWLAAAAAVAAGIAVPIALSGGAALNALGGVAHVHVLALIALVVASGAARALKLRLMAARLGYRIGSGRALIAAFASDAAFQITPAGAGGYPATMLLLRRGGLPAPAGVALSAADQALDTAFFALALPLACAFDLGAAMPASWRPLAWLPAALVAAACVAGAAAWRWRARWWPLLRRWLLRFAWLRARRERLRAFRDGVFADLARLRSGSPLATGALVASVAVQWLTRYGVLWLTLLAFGHTLPFGLVFVAQSVALHAAQWTGVPAGIGGGDVALAAALSPWAPLAAVGPALLLWRLGTFHAVLLLGAAAFVCDRARFAPPSSESESADEGRDLPAVVPP
jgi:uncharacterized protein (TIRG00374 family)